MRLNPHDAKDEVESDKEEWLKLYRKERKDDISDNQNDMASMVWQFKLCTEL